MKHLCLLAGGAALLCTGLAVPLSAAAPPVAPDAIARIQQEAGGDARVSLHRATGAASFVAFGPGAEQRLPGADAETTAAAFFSRHGDAFGIRSAEHELELVRADGDSLGHSRLEYRQVYQGVPVFGGLLRAHFGPGGGLRVVSGAFVPGIAVDTDPSWSAEAAGEVAVRRVGGQIDRPLAGGAPDVVASELVVFRQGLLQGVAGESRLAWKVDVGNGADVLEHVFVDAHTGKVLDQITGIEDAMLRRAFDGETNFQINNPFWVEGNAFPTANAEANNVIRYAEHAYDLFFNSFGFDSWDGAGDGMDTIFNRTASCPNASWNGTTQVTSFCPGVTPDDVVIHEWSHAYTDGTHDLIYQWQSGALNESYSDFWGEVVDLTNGWGTDAPGAVRDNLLCSAFGGSALPTFTVNSPGGIAGDYTALEPTAWGPGLDGVGVTGNLVLVQDGVGGANSACTANGGIANGGAVSGNIALVRRGTCNFTEKVKNAQLAGAVATVVINNAIGPPIPMGGTDPTITIPSVMVSMADGNLFVANLPVNITMLTDQTTVPSYRWLVGEDSPAFGGAIRDMWNPNCFGNAARVLDSLYHCDGAVDNGGVHFNSGIPNKGYALIVDGGTFNGETVPGIGIDKAGAIYWRAQSVYQTPVTDFSHHADSLYQSCLDLLGQTVDVFTYGIFADGFEDGTDDAWAAPTPAVIASGDCDAVAAMIAAVELHEEPVQCAFEPLLDPNAPAVCGGASTIAEFDFEAGAGSWVAARRNVLNPITFDDRDWAVVGELPNQRPGQAFFGPDPIVGDCVADNDAGVLTLTSPNIVLTGTSQRVRFDHWVATEATWDGGNLKMSVNGGPFVLVPAANYTFNPYNGALVLVNNDNPMAGEAAFTGANEGSVGSGSWGQSQIDLTGLASSADTIQLRFEMGTDGCNGSVGWYVDDVVVYSCP